MRAFWRYDHYPYVLSGTVTQYENEKVETKQYGAGSWFSPIVILPDPEGDEVAEKLEALRLEYRKAQDSLKEQYLAQRNAIAPFMRGKP